MLKGTLYILLLSTLLISCHKDTTDDTPRSCNFSGFRYYSAKKDTLGELSNNYLLVSFDTTYSETEIRQFISSASYFDQNYHYKLYSNKYVGLKFNGPKTCEEITGIIFNLQKNPSVAYASYTMKANDCQSPIMTHMGNLCVYSYSNFFYVEVLDANNLTDLYKMIAETKTELVAPFLFTNTWFTLRATKNSKGDAWAMANYFYESKLFSATDPDILKFPVE